MDAFVGKLMDIGVPSQHGVFVSTSGYTSGALARARSAGVRPLVLTGLNERRIASSVAGAFQSVVYLMADVVSMTATNNAPTVRDPLEMLVFYDREGRLLGSLPDIVRERWIRGEIPEGLGEHEFRLSEAADWHTLVEGKMEPVLGVWAKVRVLGLVITIHGTSEQHLLVNADEKTVEKIQLTASFPPRQGPYPVTVAQTEDELNSLLRESASMKVTIGRIRLPRIRVRGLYWPPSERTARELVKLGEAYLAGSGPDPREMDLSALEGTDLRTAWEPGLNLFAPVDYSGSQ